MEHVIIVAGARKKHPPTMLRGAGDGWRPPGKIFTNAMGLF
jgi:hypothetical protein